jgi:hypothetical protein
LYLSDKFFLNTEEFGNDGHFSELTYLFNFKNADAPVEEAVAAMLH